jgi:hypothetical protein
MERDNKPRGVRAVDPTTFDLVATFPSVSIVAKAGFNAGNVWRCTTGRRYLHRGLKWIRDPVPVPEAKERPQPFRVAA